MEGLNFYIVLAVVVAGLLLGLYLEKKRRRRPLVGGVDFIFREHAPGLNSLLEVTRWSRTALSKFYPESKVVRALARTTIVFDSISEVKPQDNIKKRIYFLQFSNDARSANLHRVLLGSVIVQLDKQYRTQFLAERIDEVIKVYPIDFYTPA